MTTTQHEAVRAIVRPILRCLLACLGGIRVEGAELVPRSGGVMIAPNHLSHADPMLLGAALDRGAWFIATDELFGLPVLGLLARALRAYPIRQDTPDLSALRATERLLRSGEAVVAFPEGHESLDGTLQPLQGGVVLAALRAGVPIIPAGIVGTDRMLPPRDWRPRHAREPMLLRFGEPLDPEKLSGGLQGRRAVRNGINVLAEEICRLSDQNPPNGVRQAAVETGPNG